MSLGGKWTSDRVKLNSSAIIRKVPIKDACVGKLAPSSHSDKVDIFNFLQGLLIVIRKPVGVLKCAINSNWSQRFPERIGLFEPPSNWWGQISFVLIKRQSAFKFCAWAKLFTHEGFLEGGRGKWGQSGSFSHLHLADKYTMICWSTSLGSPCTFKASFFCFYICNHFLKEPMRSRAL